MVWWNPLTWFARACTSGNGCGCKSRTVNKIADHEVKANNYLNLQSGDRFYHLGRIYMKIGFYYCRDCETGDLTLVQHLSGYEAAHGMHTWQIVE